MIDLWPQEIGSPAWWADVEAGARVLASEQREIDRARGWSAPRVAVVIRSTDFDGGCAHRALADWHAAHVDYAGALRAVVERAAQLGRRTRGSSPSLTWAEIAEDYPSLYALAAALDNVATSDYSGRRLPSRGVLP